MSSVQFSVWFVLIILNLVNTSDLQPWELYLNKGSVKRPLGLIVNETLVSHQHFVVGYTCLHTFLYDSAPDAFDLALKIDPTFVEAHIGRLFGHKHVLWGHTDRLGALQVWEDSWSTFDKHDVTLTPLQLAYFNAIFQFFAYENVRDGEKAFLASMSDLTNKYPLENDAQTLLGLAYLNEAFQGFSDAQTTETPTLLQARQILQTAIEREPTHPGCLHYLIHAFDVSHTNIAVKAVPYMYELNIVAPTASHVVHMPSHIWNRIGKWSLAQSANARSVQKSLMLCVLKHKKFNRNNKQTFKASTLTLAHLLAPLDMHQSHTLLACDRQNRIHAQDWLVYAYIQTGRYDDSVVVLNDFLLSYDASSSDSKYLPLIYRARSFITIETFFWLMYNKEENQKKFISSIDKIGLITDPSSIEHVIDALSESLIRFAACLRLLMDKKTDKSTTKAFNYHLTQMVQLMSNNNSGDKSTSIRVAVLVLQVQALRWCFDEEVEQCLIQLETATEVETGLVKDFDGPELTYTRSAELFAFYLLVFHRSSSSLSSTYHLKYSSAQINDFPSIAFDLYEKTNKTAPNRGSNMLGMARAQAGMGHTSEATQLYQELLHEWSHSRSSSNIDQIVIQEANDYLHYKSV